MNRAFLKAVEVGTKYKFPHWNESTIGTIGAAITDMVLDRLNYELDFASYNDQTSNEILVKLMKLSFIFLSRRIELNPENSGEAFMKRASLSQHYSSLLNGIQMDRKDDIISDNYYASIAYSRLDKDAEAATHMRLAISLYLKYTPNSKNNFSKGNLYKSVLEGKEKNEKLNKELLSEYQADKLVLSYEVLENAFWNKQNWVEV